MDCEKTQYLMNTLYLFHTVRQMLFPSERHTDIVISKDSFDAKSFFQLYGLPCNNKTLYKQISTILQPSIENICIYLSFYYLSYLYPFFCSSWPAIKLCSNFCCLQLVERECFPKIYIFQIHSKQQKFLYVPLP